MLQRQEVVEAIAKETGYPMCQVSKTLESLWGTIGKSFKKEGGVQLTGYLTIGVVEKKARIGRNPHTGETINIPKRKAVQVKAGSKLKAYLA